jgi:hypothetical protein
LSCFIASIGKLWGDCGLKDILVDSSVYAAGTVDQMMCGKQFNRAVRGIRYYRKLWSIIRSGGIVTSPKGDILTIKCISFKRQNTRIPCERPKKNP